MSSRSAAIVAIAVQAAALIRTFIEYLRLTGNLQPYLTGSIIAAVSVSISIALFFSRKYRAVIVVAACMVAILIVYKIVALGW